MWPVALIFMSVVNCDSGRHRKPRGIFLEVLLSEQPEHSQIIWGNRLASVHECQHVEVDSIVIKFYCYFSIRGRFSYANSGLAVLHK